MAMILDMLSRLARVRFTVGYAASLAAVSTALLILGPQVREQVVRNASTNLHNLAHGNLGTLFGSAFVTDAGPMWFWLPGLVCLLALAELLWRTGRLTVVFLTGHIGATLLVAAAGAEFTDAGHAIGLVLGMLVALRLRGPARWTRLRYLLLGVGAAFGFVLLAHTGWSVLAGVVAGALGAVAADAVVRFRQVRRPVPILAGA